MIRVRFKSQMQRKELGMAKVAAVFLDAHERFPESVFRPSLFQVAKSGLPGQDFSLINFQQA